MSATCSPYRHFLVLFLAAFLGATSGSLSAQAPGRRANLAPPAEADLIIQFKSTATEDEMSDAIAQAGAKVRRHVQTRAMKAARHRGLTHASTQGPVDEALRRLRQHPAVEFAEPNQVYTHQTVANDPYFTSGYLWGAYGDLTSPANVYGSQAGEAWNAGFVGTNSVYVGIIDEGMQFNHPDLVANVWTNPFEAADGADNDANGYADDMHGWNFFSGNNTIYDPLNDDHGTHVAGTIGASGGNGVGVAGINWNITLIPAKFLGANGGTTLGAVEAIDYFVDLKTRHGLDIVALNNSWGGGGYSQALHDAIIRAAKAGILFVAAAGNGDANGIGLNNDVTPAYPANYDTRQGTSTQAAASYDSVIAVAAIDSSGARATFSNYGAKTVHLGAPGVAIYSTLPGDTYGAYSGTSMATPHVTGAVALYASTHPTANASQIRNAILGAVTPTPSLAGITFTGGRLNLSDVIAPAATPPPVVLPAPPSGLTATASKALVNSSASVTLQWTASSSAVSYNVKRSTSVSGPFTTIATGVTGSSFASSVTASGTAYYFVVSAVNASGESADSAPASAAPLSPTPRSLTAAPVSRSQINLAWSDQSADEAGFKVEMYDGNYGFWRQLGAVPANTTGASVSGLAGNHLYYFRIRAYNGSVNTSYSNTASARTLN